MDGPIQVESLRKTFALTRSVTLTDQWRNAMMTFATYPGPLFRGAVKVVLFTALPAVFINTFPVRALRSLADAGLALAGALGVLAAGAAAFHLGLRRYESGNLLAMRE
jgi:ABC-2 type transport system permease protein